MINAKSGKTKCKNTHSSDCGDVGKARMMENRIVIRLYLCIVCIESTNINGIEWNI